MSVIEYAEGSVVTYEPFGGGPRAVYVTSREADIKNGRPGFEGVILNRASNPAIDFGFAWGYDSQILSARSATPSEVTFAESQGV